jgi:hypothetical protein
MVSKIIGRNIPRELTLQAIIADISLLEYKRPNAIRIDKNNPIGIKIVKYCNPERRIKSITESLGSLSFATSPRILAN